MRTMLLAVALVSAGTTVANGQSLQTSALTGTVFDSSRAVVAGAAVTIAGSSLVGGAQTRLTDDEGAYRFAALPPGTYLVVAEMTGFRSVKHDDVRVPVGTTLTLDFTLDVAQLRDTVVIRGESPMVDVQSAAAPTRFDREWLENLPTNRDLSAVINLVPGVAADVSFGGSQKSNALYVDGVSTTDPQLQDPLLRFNFNWVEQVQVVSLGAAAEHGGFTGVAQNAVLRSGSNHFSGLVEYWTTRPGWVGRNTDALSAALQRQFESRRVEALWESSAHVGGPVLQDRVWFFSGLQTSTGRDKPAGYTGAGLRDERDRQFLLKATTAVTSNLRVESFVQRGVTTTTGEYIGPFVTIDASNDTRFRQTTWNTRATWVLSPRMLLEGRHGGYNHWIEEGPHAPATQQGPTPLYDRLTGVASQNANWYFGQDSREHATSVALSREGDRWLGRHDLKVGIEHERTHARQSYGYTTGRVIDTIGGVPSYLYVWAGDAGNANTGRTVLYAQDNWRILPRLTLSPGLRYERNRGSVPVFGQIFATNPISPRLGLAWDLTGSHKTVVRAHIGRYHDAIFSSRIMFGDTSEVTSQVVYEILPAGDLVELSRTNPSVRTGYDIDDNLRHSYVNQVVAGIEHQVFSDVSVTAQYVRRRFDTFMGIVDTGSIYVPVERRDPGQDGRLNTPDDGDVLTIYALTNPGNKFRFYTNPEGAFNRYDAVQLIARKRYSRGWQMQSSYTWSRSEGTVGNRWHVNAGRFNLGDPGNFVNPNTRINAFGRASFDPTHEVKVLGTYRVARFGGASLSAVYRYTTGAAWGRTAFFTGLPQGGQSVQVEPQGTRRAPAINRIDVRVEKTFTIHALGTLRMDLFVDAFNLTNQAVPNSDLTDPVSRFSGPNFGTPTAWVDPRLLRATLRVRF